MTSPKQSKDVDSSQDKPTATYSDGLEDGQQLGIFMVYRLIKAEEKLHAYNSGAGRVLKTLEEKLKKMAGEL